MKSCIYASATWGIHDERWVDALAHLGYDPILIRLGYEATTLAGLRSAVTESSHPDTPILAGPLNAITESLLGVPGRLIGLSWGSDLYEPIDYTWLPQLDGLVVDSTATFNIAVEMGVPKSRITLIPWGIDLKVFAATGPRADLTRWQIPQDAQVVITLRAHEPHYRVSDVIEAFATVVDVLPSAHLLVGHSGSLTKALTDQTHQLGLDAHVHFIGTVAEKNLAPLLRASDCYVTASEVDGSSVTLLQAMACGTPVVGSDSPGNLGWITPRITGRIFRTGDVDDLAEQILNALNSPREPMTSSAAALIQAEANWAANLSRLKKAVEGA